jgi:uncharacterized protein with PIN domain
VSRIRKAYEAQFRSLLQRARARRLEQGVQWLVAKAQRLSATQGVPLSTALTQVCEALARQTAKTHSAKPLQSPRHPTLAPPRLFLCDAGLGGLARWLRAAGYEAFWQPDIADDELLRQARKLSATILTTDSMLMERRVLRDRIIPAFWLPPTLSIAQQLALVFREFDLKAGEPRCMSCGGELVRRDKEALRDRIPPRTYRWLDEYFVCARCDKLFWRGTHWERIRGQLTKATL